MPSYLDKLFSLEGHRAVITGGTRGIGQSMALALAGAGADIILIQRDEKNLETKQKIEALGRKAFVYTADMGSQEQVEAITKRILDDGHDVDILITSAGIQRRHPAHVFPMNDWHDVGEDLSWRLELSQAVLFSYKTDICVFDVIGPAS